MKKDVKDTFVPVYWRGNVKDVEDTVALVKHGKVTKLLPSAGGRNIYMVEYGKSNLPKSQATLSSALGARDIRCYADKTHPDYIPTVMLVGCMHGGEWEGTVAINNLIKMLETGTDYAGNTNEKLIELCSKVHLVLIPISNPDGRARVPFDNFVGKTFEDLRYYDQGTWLDGTLCGWPGCKQHHPIKDHVEFLGGYFNDDGVNMMHDDFFINPSNEVRNVLTVARDNAPDITLLYHGGDNGINHFVTNPYCSAECKRQLAELGKEFTENFAKEGLRFGIRANYATFDDEAQAVAPSFSFPSAMYHVCGEPATTYESNQGLCDRGDYKLTNDEIYRCHMISIETTIEWALRTKSAEARLKNVTK